MIQEKVNGQQCSDILLDTGAVISLAAKSLVKPGDYTGEQLTVGSVLAVDTLPLANIEFEIDGRKSTLEVVVQDKKLSAVLLLGISYVDADWQMNSKILQYPPEATPTEKMKRRQSLSV